MKKICILGLNPAWQKTLTFEQLTYGAVNRASDLETIPSGKGINFARAVHTWEKAEGTVYQFLAGDAGKKIRQGLWEENLSHISNETAGETRTCTTVISAGDGMVTELIEPSPFAGPMAAGQLFRQLCTGLEQADALAICGTCPPGINEYFYTKAAARARELEKFILVDSCQYVQTLLEEGADLLKINREEICKLTGTDDLAEALKLAFSLFKIRYLAITDGPGNAWFSDGKELIRYTIPALEKVVSPIGCGDTCSGVMLSEILAGTDPAEAFRYGLAAASANCLTPMPAQFDPVQAEELHGKITLTHA